MRNNKPINTNFKQARGTNQGNQSKKRNLQELAGIKETGEGTKRRIIYFDNKPIQ